MNPDYFNSIKEGEKALKNKFYYDAIAYFHEARSIIGLVKVMNSSENEKNASYVKYDVIKSINDLTGKIWQ